jgi:hypothetical protein
MWWVGRGISGGSAELEGGATVYLYSVGTFALAIVIYCTMSRSSIIAASEGSCGFDAGRVRFREPNAGGLQTQPAPTVRAQSTSHPTNMGRSKR